MLRVSTRISMTVTQLLDGSSIWRIPICFEDFLKLWNNGRIVCPKANSGCRIEIIPNQIAGTDVCTNIANCVFPMIDSGVAWVDISSTLSFVNGRSGQVVTWHLMVLYLYTPRTSVLLGRIAEDIGVEKRLQVELSFFNKICPIRHKYLHFRMLREYNLWDCTRKRWPINCLLCMLGLAKPFPGTDPYCASISDGFNRIEPPLFIGLEPAEWQLLTTSGIKNRMKHRRLNIKDSNLLQVEQKTDSLIEALNLCNHILEHQ